MDAPESTPESDFETARRDSHEQRSKSPTLTLLPGRKPKLKALILDQPELYARMLQFIRAGAYDYQVAQAIGIDHTTFAAWMRKGAASHGGPYRKFYREVSQARAQCRILAEVSVRQDDPKYWLTHGPGKTRAGQPGWTDQVIIGGDEELPIHLQHEHQHSGNVTHTHTQTSTQELAASLAILQQLGVFTIDPKSKTPAIAGLGTIIENSDGSITFDDEDDSDDDDDYNEDLSDGHLPDAEISIDNIPSPRPRR